jgi:hypothetical protein
MHRVNWHWQRQRLKQAGCAREYAKMKPQEMAVDIDTNQWA